MDNLMFMAYDGDNAGRMVGRAVLADDVEALRDASERITHGHEVVKQWVESHGGQIISGGGDEGTFQVPVEALENIEQLRADYQYATQLTMTVGVGSSLSEAGKALMVGKFRGKNQAVQYDPSIEQELSAANEHVAQGSATDEEKKINEAYFSKDEHQHTDDCQYCKEAEAKQSGHDHAGDDCKYCQEMDAQASHEHTDDCQYCKEADAKEASHEHTGDDCQYCQEMAQPQGDENAQAPAPEANPAQPPQEAQQNAPGLPGTPEQNVEALASQLETDDPHTQEEADLMGQIDATDLAVGHSMQDNVSRPDGYEQEQAPADMGLSEDEVPEESPDLGEVLRSGLDNHADSIAREKVVGLVSQALEGFKACKPILEKAKQQAPQLYESSIAMLRAMIEMAKMLGLDSQAEAQPEAQEQPAEEAQDQDQNEWNDPFPRHPDHDAAPQEGAAQAPQQ